MGLLLGDNLGLNITLGFSKSFSSNYFCRFCLTRKCDSQVECCERQEIFRNRINYRESFDRELVDPMGISSICIFNDIPSFHCTENFAVDIMHDLFEGICHLIISNSLLYFIKKMEFFSLQTLNDRLSNFHYEKYDKGNQKQNINYSELESHKLKMSAKQMMAFCHYFTILIGDFIPNDDPVWQFLLSFFELVDDILCYEISDSLINQVKNKIENINKNFMTFFKRKLTPKFHFLVHYPTIMKMSGPLRNLWCFKFENKHKEFKIYSHIITSRKNIAKSFSHKQQIIFADLLLQPNVVQNIFNKPHSDVHICEK